LLPPLPRPDVAPFVLALEPQDSLTVTFASDVTSTPFEGLAMTPENKSQVVAAVAAHAAAGKIDLLESLMSCLNRSSHVVVALGDSKPKLGVTDTNLILSAIQNLLLGDLREPKVRIDVLGSSNELSRGLADLTGGGVFETVQDMVMSSAEMRTSVASDFVVEGDPQPEKVGPNLWILEAGSGGAVAFRATCRGEDFDFFLPLSSSSEGAEEVIASVRAGTFATASATGQVINDAPLLRCLRLLPTRSVSKPKSKKHFKPVQLREYLITSHLASGAYGQVFLASKSGSNYAIKKFAHGDPSYDRELRLLKHFKHPNVISLVDAFTEAQASFVVLPHVATDLGRLIASRQPLNLKQTKYLAWQTLLGLLHVHSAGVAHRDLKPGNILVTASGAVSICDFGMSKSLEVGGDATEYVVTRFYRAPELLLGAGYGKQVDIWSYGCILGELFTRDALFKGQNYVEQLRSILRLVGASIESVSGWEEGGIRKFLGTCPGSDVGSVVPGADGGGKALLAACLCLNPEKRPGAEELARDKWWKGVRRKGDVGRAKEVETFEEDEVDGDGIVDSDVG